MDDVLTKLEKFIKDFKHSKKKKKSFDLSSYSEQLNAIAQQLTAVSNAAAVLNATTRQIQIPSLALFESTLIEIENDLKADDSDTQLNVSESDKSYIKNTFATIETKFTQV